MPTITGTPGDDVIVGGPGGDIIDGLAGNDTITDRGAGVTQIRGGDGNDTIRYLDFANGLLNATITIDAGNGDDAVFFDSLHLDSASSVAINLGAGNDTLHLGTATREADRPYWYSYSYAAPMTIDLGPGSDTLVLGYYFGRIVSASFTDFSANNVIIPRVSGFTAGNGGDVLDIGDLMFGLFADFNGGQWNGSGNPFTGGFLRLVQVGADVILRFDSNGLADTSPAIVKDVVRLVGVQLSSLTAANFNGYDPTGGALAPLSRNGTAGDDVLSGTAALNTINGLGGNDTIYGDATPDVLDGGDGDDTIFGGFGNDTILGGLGADVLDGGAGNDRIEGGAGNDIIRGDIGDDLIYGGDGDDTITDTLGNDRIYGGGGNDTILVDHPVRVWFGSSESPRGPETIEIYGEDGDDRVTLRVGLGNNGFNWQEAPTTVLVDLGAGNDIFNNEGQASYITLTMGAGRDRLNVINFSFSLTITDFETGDTGDVVNLLPYIGDFVDFDYTTNPFASGVLQLEQSGTDVVLYFDQDGTAGFSPRELWITFQNTTLGNFTAYNFLGLPPDGSAIVGQTVTGTSGNDLLNGTIGADTINGLGGNDTIYGEGGDDTINGGGGNDYIEGGDGADRITGGAGDDTVLITNGSDIVDTGAGRDRVIHDNLITNTRDTILIDTGADDDVVEIRRLAAGNGGSQRHEVNLGDGNDQLLLTTTGIRGLSATLGAGSDLVWLSPEYAGPFVRGPLYITDFQTGAGGDVLDLADYANAYFFGSTPNTGIAGDVRLLQLGTDVVVQIRQSDQTSYQDVAMLLNTVITDFVFENLNVDFGIATISANPSQPTPSIIPEFTLGTVTTEVPVTIYSTESVTVGANEVYRAFDGTFFANAFRTQGIFLIEGNGSLVNNGTIWNEVWGTPTLNDILGAFVLGDFENNGLINVSAYNGVAAGAFINGQTGINTGDIVVRVGIADPTSAAYGIRAENSQLTFTNSGTIAAQSYGALGVGIEYVNGGRVINQAGGEILVEAPRAYGVVFGRGNRFQPNPEIVNEGLIQAVSLDPERLSYGLYLSHFEFETMRVVNSGTIIADIAIFADHYTYSQPALAAEQITNTATGVIRGDIFLDLGDDTLINQGSITGDVFLGFGDDIFDSTGGRWTGTIIDLNLGDDLFRGSLNADTVVGGLGDDDLYGNEGNDLLIGNRGDDYIEGGLGNDGLYGETGNDTLVLRDGDRAFGGAQDDLFILTDYRFREARGEAGVDTLRLSQAAARVFDLSAALATGRLSGFEWIELGASHGLVVRAGDVSALSDVANTLVVSETAAGASLSLVGSWALGSQTQLEGQTFNTYTLGNETVLVLSAIEVTVGANAPGGALGLDAISSGTAAPVAGVTPGTERDEPFYISNGLRLWDDLTIPAHDAWYSTNGRLLFFSQIIADTTFRNYGYVLSETTTPTAAGAGVIQLESTNRFENYGYVGAIANEIGNAVPVFFIGLGSFYNEGLIEAIADNGTAIGLFTGSSDDIEVPSVENRGEIYAESTLGYAIGIYNFNADLAINSGDIFAVGATGATAVYIDQSLTTYNNSGRIIAQSNGEGVPSIGFEIYYSGQLELINSGLVAADALFFANDITNPSYLTVRNTGELYGVWLLDEIYSEVFNAGLIDGDIFFGNYRDTYDGAGGTHIGRLYAGSGNDTLLGTAGTDWFYGEGGADTLSGRDGADFLIGGAGNDTIDGGSNVDTAIVNGNRALYTVTQTSTGVFRVVGPDGTDTLTGVEYLQFNDQIMRLRPGTGVTVNFSSTVPSGYQSAMDAIRDFDGNALGGNGSWGLIGAVDVNGDGDLDRVLVNGAIGRFATVGTAPDGLVYFNDHGWAGETRVAGIYIDPLVISGDVIQGSDFDSQRRFQNDLLINNINRVLGADDFDDDGVWEVYFALTDGTAYLRALMHADGNIRYANYQSEQQVIEYLTANGYDQTTFGDWFGGGSSAAPDGEEKNDPAAPERPLAIDPSPFEEYGRPFDVPAHPLDAWQPEHIV